MSQGFNREVINNPNNPCPPEILAQQVSLTIPFVDFSGNLQDGIIEVNEEVQDDVVDFFSLALKLRFPIKKVIPSSHPDYLWDDNKLMEDNTSSGFNYRRVAGAGRISLHAYGRAFDINTGLNPYIRYENGQTIINGKVANVLLDSVWDKSKPGTLYADHPLVDFMENRGWEWGGHWTLEKEGIIDYQHFQKPER